MARRQYEFHVKTLITRGEERVLEEIRYTANTFKGSKGISCLTRLVKLGGPAFEQVISSYDSKSQTVDTELLGAALTSLLAEIESGKVVNLINDLLESVEGWYDDKRHSADLDNYFSDNYGALIGVLIKVVMENYGSFIQGGGSGLLGLLPTGLLPKSAEE